MDAKIWRKQVKTFRARKDEFFGSAPQSPIPAEVRRRWKGLRYYKPDYALRFAAPVILDEPRILKIPRSSGPPVEYQRVGTAAFQINDKTERLALFTTAEDNKYFVPFRDATSGNETYGAGRYMDCHRVADGVILDFNYAYHPYCAYNESYACPLPPPENWLKVPIRAGERL